MRDPCPAAASAARRGGWMSGPSSTAVSLQVVPGPMPGRVGDAGRTVQGAVRRSGGAWVGARSLPSVLALATTSGTSRTSRASPPLSMSWTRSSTCPPSAWKSWRTVDSGGRHQAVPGTSSKPITATSSGIRTPPSCSALSRPSAIWSLPVDTARGRPSLSSWRPTRYPSETSQERPSITRAGVPARVIEGRSWEVSEGYRVGRQLLSEGLPRAVSTGNDQMALGLLSALHEGGVRIPEDVAVMGFDDVPGTAWWRPPLSTVRQDFHALGGQVLDLVQDMLSGGEARDVRLVPEVVARASTLGSERAPTQAPPERRTAP